MVNQCVSVCVCVGGGGRGVAVKKGWLAKWVACKMGGFSKHTNYGGIP